MSINNLIFSRILLDRFLTKRINFSFQQAFTFNKKKIAMKYSLHLKHTVLIVYQILKTPSRILIKIEKVDLRTKLDNKEEKIFLITKENSWKRKYKSPEASLRKKRKKSKRNFYFRQKKQKTNYNK